MITLPRNAQIWVPGYARWSLLDARRPPAGRGCVWLAIADHYEPLCARATMERARQRVALWRRRWPEIAAGRRDSAGCPPRYTFFYPEEEYRPELLEPLAEMTRAGIGDVEVHLHHDGEGRQNFIDRMSGFVEVLRRRHGLLRDWDGKPVFGFIHGNWALDNSRPDGRWCGLNDEITLLNRLGCYADFTMPSASSPTQARTVNTIYWAVDDPQKPKSYDTGIRFRRGGARGDLLMIPGPLGVRWRGLRPRMECGELSGYDLPGRYRARRWLDLAPAVEDDIFLKLHAHGCQERNSGPLLDSGLDHLFEAVEAECGRRGYRLRYATAWEMYQAVTRTPA